MNVSVVLDTVNTWLDKIRSFMCLVRSEQQHDDRHKQRHNFHTDSSQLLFEKVSCWHLHHYYSNRRRCTRYWLHTLCEQTDLISSLAKWQCKQSVAQILFENQIGFVCSVNKDFKLRHITHHSIWCHFVSRWICFERFTWVAYIESKQTVNSIIFK